MAMQGNLFSDIGSPIPRRQGELFGRNAIPAGFRHATGTAPNMAPNNPGYSSFLKKQTAFDFSKSTSAVARTGRGARALKAGIHAAKGSLSLPMLLIDAGLIAGMTIGGGIEGASKWGAATGLEEDYIGGAIYGATKGFGHGVGGSLGGIAGAATGAAIGSAIFPGIGTAIGGIVGGLAGYWGGDAALGAIAGGVGRDLGMGARAIVKTTRAVDTVQFGGNFVDTQAAYTMRQRAVSDMSGSMMNARQFLGNEAIFLHER